MENEKRIQKLREWRIKSGITQDELADIIGYKTWAVSSWEQGRNPVPRIMMVIVFLATAIGNTRFFKLLDKIDKILGRE